MKKSIQPIDGTLIDTTNPGQNEPGRNGHEGVHHIPQVLKMKPHHQIPNRVIFKIFTFPRRGMDLTPLQRTQLVDSKAQLTSC